MSILKTFFAAAFLLILGCSQKASQGSGKLDKVMAGLSILDTAEYNVRDFFNLITSTDNLAFPAYSETGELLTAEQIKAMKGNSEMTLDSYVDSTNNIKAVVLRKHTSKN